MADINFSSGTTITSTWLNYVNDGMNELPQVNDLPTVDYRRDHKNFAYDYVTDTIVIKDGTSDNWHRHFGSVAEGIDGRLHLIYRRAPEHANTSGATVYYTTSDDGGLTWTTDVELVSAITGFDQGGMSIGCTPTGRLIVIYDKVPAPLAAPISFWTIYSDDNGATWSTPVQITSVNFTFARSYGRIKLIPGDSDSNWRLAWTPYWQAVVGPPAQYTIPVYTSEDNGITWTAGTPIHLSTAGYNEAELVAINAKVWFAVARGSGLNLFKSVDAGATWSLVGVIPTTDGVAPTLDKFEYNGKWYLLVGYCDRSLDTTAWKIAAVESAINDATTSFSQPMVIATDMVNASGYQTVITKPDGCVYLDGGTAYIEFKEYIGFDYSQVRFVRMNLFQETVDTPRVFSVASGAITIPTLFVDNAIIVSTEGGAATDDLDTINGGAEGQVLIFKSSTASADTIFKNGTGNLQLVADYRLNTATDSRIVLIKSGTKWYELARGNDQTTTTLTIATGAVTVPSARTVQLHTIDTEGAAATDDLDTINGGLEGQMVVFHSVASARDVVFKDGTGNLRLAGDFTLSNGEDTITLIKGTTVWREVSRSDNNV